MVVEGFVSGAWQKVGHREAPSSSWNALVDVKNGALLFDFEAYTAAMGACVHRVRAWKEQSNVRFAWKFLRQETFYAISVLYQGLTISKVGWTETPCVSASEAGQMGLSPATLGTLSPRDRALSRGHGKRVWRFDCSQPVQEPSKNSC